MSDSRLQINWRRELWKKVCLSSTIWYVANFTVYCDYSRLKNSSVWRQISLLEWDDESNDLHCLIKRIWNFRRKKESVSFEFETIWLSAKRLSLISRNQDQNACIWLDSIKAWRSFVFWSKAIIIRHRICERYKGFRLNQSDDWGIERLSEN
jgi:hypothetical protein